MQELLRWLASWQGIPVDPDAEMQFELSSFPSGGLGLLVLLGVLLALVYVSFVYRRDGRNLARWQRLVLASLRVVALLAAVALLLEPNLVAIKHQTRPGATILLVDTSQSMKQVDAWRREQVAAVAEGWRRIGVADPAAVTRFDLVRTLLARDDGALVRKLGARNQVQLYGYAAGLESLPTLPEAAQPGNPPPGQPAPATDLMQPPRLDLDKLTADGRYSNLGGALRSACDRSRNAEIAAIVILGDGRRNAGPQGAEIARMLNQRKVPNTFVLGIGDPSETQVVGIGRFEAPEKVFEKDPFEIRGAVLAQGYDQMQVTVRLLRIDEKGETVTVRTEPVTVGGNVAETPIEWKDIASAETGKFTYRLEVLPPSGEPPAPERHRRDLPVEVLGERTRVLLLAGGASHEFQILRNLLIRDKTIDVSCWLQSADPDFPQDGDEDVRLEELPAEQKQLEPYDVAILVDPNPGKLTPAFCEMLAKHVLENGCGLWWVAGEKFSLEAFKPTATTKQLVDLLPVVPDLSYAESVANLGLGLAYKDVFPYALTPEGEDGVAAKITRIADNRDDSKRIWSQLPGFHLAFPVRQVKPAATIIAEHRGADARLRREGHGMPLIATQSVGAARTLYCGMDETYRWRSLFEDAYNRFWVKGIRYLFEGRVHAGNSRVKLRVSDDKLELGEALTVTVEMKDELLRPLVEPAVDIGLEQDGKTLDTLRLLPVEETPGTYQVQLRPAQIGSYRLRTAKVDGKSVEMPFQVVPALIESEGPMDRAELAAVAAATGGKLFDTPAELLAALDTVPSRTAIDTFRTPHAIWDGWGTVAFMLGALALEWILRKRFNLL